MRIPVIQGLIKRRLLVNFRADADVVQRLLPAPFRPKLQAGYAIVGICLIRLEQVRPRGLPAMFGIASENAAHRFAVEWTDATGDHVGVYIPRRDTGSRLNNWAGGRVFPGEHALAKFAVHDVNGLIDLTMRSTDGQVSVHVVGTEASALPATSCFASLSDVQRFFEAGCIGYSKTCDPGRLDGLRLKIDDFLIRAFAVSEVESSYFSDLQRFPAGSISFDHALIMRDISHEWHQAQDMRITAPSSASALQPV